MPWCPKCKNEYVEGITVCADCGSELVDSLEEETLAEEFVQEGFDAWEQTETLEELPEDMANAVRLGRTAAARNAGGVYEDSAKKAEEFKSGAYTLLVVGALGLAALVLLIAGVLPVRLNPATQWMTVLVMGALFIIFIVMGVLSFQSYRRLEQKAAQERALKDEMNRFCEENLNAAQIDSAVHAEDAQEEELRYFNRTEQMKSLILSRFPDVEENYLDSFVDEIYPRIFEKDQ